MPVYLVMFIKADNPQVDDTEYLFWYIFQHQIIRHYWSSDVRCWDTKLAEIKNRWTDLLTRLRCYSFISAGGNRFLSWCKDRNFFCNFQIFEQRNQEKVYFLNNESWEKIDLTKKSRARSQLWLSFDTFSLFFLCFVQNNQYLCKCILPNMAAMSFE